MRTPAFILNDGLGTGTLPSLPNFQFRISIFLLSLGLLIFQISCTPDRSTSTSDRYTCPMHPTVISDKQGACPVCGMDLVRKARAGEEVKITGELSKTLTSPNQSVLASIRTVRGVYEARPVSLTTQGKVTYDTRHLQVLAARIDGRLERVYVKYVGQAVRAGEKVAEVYSPELETAEREFIFLVANDEGNAELIAASKQKLALLGFGAAEIEQLQKSRITDGRFTVFSPASGYIIESDLSSPSPETPGTTAMKTGGMSTPASPAAVKVESNSNAAILREGDYVSRGQTLFRIASRRAIRLEFNVSTPMTKGIRVGDVMDILADDGRTVQGTIGFIQPYFSEGENYLKVRVYDRRADLRIGQLVTGTIRENAREALWVPRESVVDVGKETIVFVKDRSGVFKPRPVTIGMRSGNWVEIRQGLASSEEIAENAAFLVDSESFIKQ
jgi:Cu(I)/Ag(I) efflux system membrane fusion protein